MSNVAKDKKKSSRVLILLQGFILLNILWILAAYMMDTPALPMPGKVYAKLPALFEKGLYQHLAVSLGRLLAGISISLLIGGSIGLAMGSSQRLNRIAGPLVYFTYPIPKTALLPVLMILFGLGDGSKITLIVLITVFQVIVAVRDSVLHIPSHYYHTLKSLGAGRLQAFYHVTFPAVLPDLLTNLRVSVGTALSVLFFAENYGTKYGVGYFIQDCWGRLSYVSMYGGILTLSFLGFILFLLIDLLEYAFCKGR